MTILFMGNSILVPYLYPNNFGGRYLGIGGLSGGKHKWVFLHEYFMYKTPIIFFPPTQNPRFPTGAPQDCWGRGKGSKYYFPQKV